MAIFWIYAKPRILSLLLVLFLSKAVQNKPRWIQTAPNDLFVLTGQDAEFTWNYDTSDTTLYYAKWGVVTDENRIESSIAFQGEGKFNATVFPQYQAKAVWKMKATLTLFNVSSEDENVYGCEVNFKDGNVLFHKSNLKVLDLILPQSQVVFLSQNETGHVNLTSFVGSKYSPGFEWLYNAKPLADHKNYTVSSRLDNSTGKTIYTLSMPIANAERHNTGLYELFAVFGLLKISLQKFNLAVWYGPGNSTALITASKKYVIQKNTAVTLTCTADSVPRPTFTFFKEGEQLSKYAAGNYTLPSMQYSDEGNYSCIAENLLGSGSKATITVFYGEKPVSLDVVTGKNISSGQLSQFQCAFKARPAAIAKWYKDGKALPEDVTVTNHTVANGILFTTTSNLTITKPGVTHPGEYTCVGENELGRAEIKHLVVVFYPPTFYPDGTPLNFSVVSGETAHFRCSASSYPGIVHYTWFFEGKVVKGHEKKSYGNLTLVNTTVADAGLYTCFVSNDISDTQGVSLLSIHVMPVLTHISESKTLQSGEKIVIECKGTGIPSPTIKWRRASSSTILHVGEVYEIDSRGMGLGSVAYECEATNVVGSVTGIIHVSVTGITQRVTGENQTQEWLIPFLIVLCIVLTIILVLIALRRRSRHEPEEVSEVNGVPKEDLYSKSNRENGEVKDEMGLVNPVFVDGAALDNQGSDKMTLNPVFMNEAQDPKLSDGTTIATKYMVYLPNDDDIDRGREEIEVSMVLSSEDSEENYTNEAFDMEGYVSISSAGENVSSTDGSLKHFVSNWSAPTSPKTDSMDKFVDGLFDFPEKQVEDHKF